MDETYGAGQQTQAQPYGGVLNAARESEVSREVNRLRECSANLNKLSQEIVARLSSVLSPKDDIAKTPEQGNSLVSTPLATNLHEIGSDLLVTEKTLRFILSSLEL